MWFLKRLDRYLCLLWDAIDAIFRTFSQKMRLNSSFWVDFGDFGVDLVPNLCFGGDLVPISPIYQHPHIGIFQKLWNFLVFTRSINPAYSFFSEKFCKPKFKEKKNEIQIPPRASS